MEESVKRSEMTILPCVERRQNPLLDILRARREHQQQLRDRRQFLVGGIEQNAADLLADGRAARFHGFEHRPPFAAQALGQHASLRAFAAAVGPFEGDEEAAAL